jgi:glutathione synthase/RimK-type ligase-like ATP-grasp enzyme
MKVIGCKRTCKTLRRMKQQIPFRLSNKKLLINLGNGDMGYTPYGYEVINTPTAVKNCSNKKRMFNILEDNDIKTLSFMDTDVEEDYTRAMTLLSEGEDIVLRGLDGKWQVVDSPDDLTVMWDDFDYATKYEEKKYEYRIIIFRDELFKIYRKLHKGDDFCLKKDNCAFIIVKPERMGSRHERMISECLRASKSLEIDLCGFDVMINTADEVKIIEANSGMAMCENTINQLYGKIK